MVLSIIFLEDKHKMLLHLSIFYEYQQFVQHRICFSIQPPDYSDPWPRLARSISFFLIMLFNYRDRPSSSTSGAIRLCHNRISVVFTHGHIGQLPCGPILIYRLKDMHVSYCINTDFVGCTNTINICLSLWTIYIFIP